MKSKETFTRTEADEIIRLIQEKLKADTNRQKSIRNKIRKIGFHASDYGFRNGYTVKQFLSVAKIKTTQELDNAKDHYIVSSVKLRDQSDESYVICLCDEVLQQTSLKQHRFDFLRGDSDSKLPVDAYYPSLNLVIEFRERQHTEEVKFFDRKQTVSGVSRGEQRKLYDQRRREVLPEHGIKLIEFDYSDFKHTSSKKLIGDKMEDLKVVKGKLKEMMK
jgi:hypothetical protein